MIFRSCFFSLASLFPSILLLVAVGSCAERSSENIRIPLHQNWQLQSSCDAKSTAEEISTSGFRTTDWHRAEVPTTVVAALVADKTYPDPNFGMTFKSFPGMNYSAASFFANQDMPDGSPFRCSWWFRTEFNVPTSSANRTTWLHFDAINYRANIWLNGQKIADSQDVAGTYRIFEFNVSKYLVRGKANALAVEVFAPGKNDLGMTWVDWNPTPADKDMGLWKDVYLTTTSSVSLLHPFVTSKLGADYKTASLLVSADLQSVTDQPVTGAVHVNIEGIRASQPVDLKP